MIVALSLLIFATHGYLFIVFALKPGTWQLRASAFALFYFFFLTAVPVVLAYKSLPATILFHGTGLILYVVTIFVAGPIDGSVVKGVYAMFRHVIRAEEPFFLGATSVFSASAFTYSSAILIAVAAAHLLRVIESLLVFALLSLVTAAVLFYLLGAHLLLGWPNLEFLAFTVSHSLFLIIVAASTITVRLRNDRTSRVS